MKEKVVIVFIAVLFLGFIFIEKEAGCMGNLQGKKIVMIISSRDFRDEELSVPAQIFKDNGAEVKIASSSLNTAVGKLGMKVKPDILYSDISVKDYDAIVFVGGPGCSDYWHDPIAHKIAKDTVGSGKVLAAICAAPATLANAGALKGKKATCFPSEGGQLTAGGAKYTAKPVEVDQNIVTADGPESAEPFAEEIIKILTK